MGWAASVADPAIRSGRDGTSSVDGPAPTSSRRDADVPRSGLVTFLVTLAYLGVALLEPRLGSNLAWVDGVLALLIVVAVFGMRVRGSAATATATRAAPWIWLILLGSLLGLSGVGIEGWALSSLARTTMALGAFFCLWYLLDVRVNERAAVVGTWMALVFSTFYALAFDTSVRSGALLGHANYLGHYAVTAGVVLFAVSRTWTGRIAAAVAIAINLYTSSSFGAMAMLIVALLVLLTRVAARNSGVLAMIMVVFGLVSMTLVLTTTQLGIESDDAAVSSTISQERFERSQGSRLELWTQAWDSFVERPWGVGPDGVKQREIAVYRGQAAEIHNDAFGYLVERGIPGLVGFIGLWVVLWRSARPGGLARVVIPMLLVAGMFRETMHFRHAWLLLALAFVFDQRAADGADARDEAERRALSDDDARPVPA